MISVVVYVALFPLLIYNNLFTVAYTFKPESKKIEVNNGGFTTFGFIDLENVFDTCYYESSDGTKNEYNITQKETIIQSPKEDASNIILPQTYTCGLMIDNINYKIGNTWNLTAIGANNKKISETVSITFYYDTTVFAETVNVLLGSSFINYLTTDVKIKSCFIVTDIKEQIILISDFKYTNIKETKSFGSRLINIKNGKCGFKLTDVAETDSDKISFVMEDDKSKLYQIQTIIAKFKLDDDVTNKVTKTNLGIELEIVCGGTNTYDNQLFCQLFNPQGNIVLEDTLCKYHIFLVTVNDLGVWTCKVQYLGSMETINFSNTLILNEKEYLNNVVTWSTKQNSQYSIGCTLVNSTQNKLNFCMFTRPDGNVFKIENGAATTRYTTLETNLQKQVCGLEIPLPLISEEIGTWKCELLYPETYGNFITVEKSSPIKFNPLRSKKVNSNHSFSIECRVPYKSDYCYILSPNKKVFMPDEVSFHKSGLCSATIPNATRAENGTWSCYFARESGIPDEKVTIEITIIDSYVDYEDKLVNKDESAELSCNSVLPLKYCRFASPQGEFYTLRSNPNKKETNHINYLGRGLDFGDCGLKIINTTENDNGEWTCYLHTSELILSAKIVLTVKYPFSGVPTVAESVGIAAGVLAIVIIICGLVFYKRFSLMFLRRSRTSNASNEIINELCLNETSLHNNYNTTDS